MINDTETLQESRYFLNHKKISYALNSFSITYTSMRLQPIQVYPMHTTYIINLKSKFNLLLIHTYSLRPFSNQGKANTSFSQQNVGYLLHLDGSSRTPKTTQAKSS